jgi:hypothetical protein
MVTSSEYEYKKDFSLVFKFLLYFGHPSFTSLRDLSLFHELVVINWGPQ